MSTPIVISATQRWQTHIDNYRYEKAQRAFSTGYQWDYSKRIQKTVKQFRNIVKGNPTGPDKIWVRSEVWSDRGGDYFDDRDRHGFHYDTYKFIITALSYFPYAMRSEVWSLYEKTYKEGLVKGLSDQKAYKQANIWLHKSATKAQGQHKFFAYGEKGLKRMAKTITSRLLTRADHIARHFDDLDDKRSAILHIRHAANVAADKQVVKQGDWTCRRLHITCASGSTTVKVKKYTDPTFWTRKLRRVIYPQREQFAKDIGLINKETSHYSSKGGQAVRKNMLASQRDWANESIAISPNGEMIPMADLIDTASKGYKAKVIAKATGLKNIAEANGWTAAMITVTCPGSFRRDGTTIQQALKHLRDVWKRIDAQKIKEGLDLAGCMVWQPHKDGFPHQHIYVIGSKPDITKLYEITISRALAVYPDEAGATERRTDIEWEDKSKGSLSSYALSYVMRFATTQEKKDTQHDDTQNGAIEKDGSAEDAFYSLNQARRIGWFGLPDDTHWDTCRKMKRKQAMTNQLKQLRKTARKGDYATWVELSGGIARKRKDRPYESLTENKQSKYGETVKRYIGSIVYNIAIAIKGIAWSIELAVVKPNYPRESENQDWDDPRAKTPPKTGPPHTQTSMQTHKRTAHSNN